MEPAWYKYEGRPTAAELRRQAAAIRFEPESLPLFEDDLEEGQIHDADRRRGGDQDAAAMLQDYLF